MNPKNQPRAWFGYSALSRRICKKIASENRARLLRESSQAQRRFADGGDNKAFLSKRKRKERCYQDGEFEALVCKGRTNREKPRKRYADLTDLAFKIKTDRPCRSADTRHRFFAQPYPLLLCSPQKRAHKRWSGDFSNGPYRRGEGRLQPTYRLLLVEPHSGYAVEVRYDFCQSLDTLIDALLHARSRYGIPYPLHLDNSKAYHAYALKANGVEQR